MLVARIEGPPWRASIVLLQAELAERRVVEAEACAGLLDASAVVIAVAMAPVVVAQRRARAFERDAPAIAEPPS